MGSESSSLDEQRYGAGPLCRCGHQFGDHAYYSDRSLGERCVWSACSCTAFRPDPSVTEEEAASLLTEDLQDMEASAPPEAGCDHEWGEWRQVPAPLDYYYENRRCSKCEAWDTPQMANTPRTDRPEGDLLGHWPCDDCGAAVSGQHEWCPNCGGPEGPDEYDGPMTPPQPSRRPPYAVAYSVDGGHLYEVMVPGDATCIAEDGVIKIQHHGHYVLGLLRVQPVNLNEESDAEADHR